MSPARNSTSSMNDPNNMTPGSNRLWATKMNSIMMKNSVKAPTVMPKGNILETQSQSNNTPQVLYVEPTMAHPVSSVAVS